MRAPLPTWVKVAIPVAVVLAIIIGVTTFAVTPDEPPPVLEVITVPSGATVTLDSVLVPGVTPVRITENLRLGTTQRVEVTLSGYEPWSTSFQAASGNVQQVVVLTPLRAVLRIETDPPGGMITVDGVPRGAAPIDIPGLPIGRHVEVRASSPGRRDVNQRIPIGADNLRPQVRLTFPPAQR
jgi:hypothetical protein